jgi:Putative peptidoglycan binding domain
MTYPGHLIRRGATGAAVRAVQAKVGAGVDGIYGPHTEAAVRRFQAAHHLAADGIVGPRTWAALFGAAKSAPPASSSSVLLPGAVSVPGESAGASTGGGAKIVHHTTEGASAAGAIGAYRASRSWPTLTAEWSGGRLHVSQHMAVTQMARALEHPPGTLPTNTANCVQIEHVGFTSVQAWRAAGSPAGLLVADWPAARWAAIAQLCRHIEARTGCPARSAVPAAWWSSPQRLGQAAFVAAAGHCGHVHVASNHHVDGTGFHIAAVLA